MDPLIGIWRLVESRAWDEQGNSLDAPYGAHPLGQIAFGNGRMLAALCNGDSDVESRGKRAYSSYGGPYSFDGTTLTTVVDMASDASRIGSRQVRHAVIDGDRMTLRPPIRSYDGATERRELVWERIWAPAE
jgi:hypothetical protein